MITQKEEAALWILSDTHLIADNLHDNGQAFAQMQKTSQGKDLYYQEIALKAFAKMAKEKKPVAIIVTGDVTFNGELLSAQKFAQIFSSLKDTRLLVLPGNHDIYDGWARKFNNEQQLYAKQISPKEWQQIFQVSYDNCSSKDPSSLAYSVQLNPRYLLIMLDSNYYGKKEAHTAPLTRGHISSKQLLWFERQLQQAQEQKLHVLLFMHHNLYVHNKAVSSGFVLDNADEVRKLCQKYDVRLAFSGHIHAQNIIGPQKKIPTIEVASSSFCSYDQGYGILQVAPNRITYLRKEFDMRPYLTKNQQKNYTLMHFHDYLKNLQFGNISSRLVQSEMHKGKYDLGLIRKMGNLFAELNFNFFTGHNQLTSKQLEQIKASTEFQTLIKEDPFFETYFKSLYDTSGHSNLHLQIKY